MYLRIAQRREVRVQLQCTPDGRGSLAFRQILMCAWLFARVVAILVGFYGINFRQLIPPSLKLLISARNIGKKLFYG